MKGRCYNGLLIGWLLLMVGITRADDLFPDDQGDSIPSAAVWILPATGLTVTNQIEIDTDQDWIRFVALPDTVYRLRAQASSLWDLELEFRGPHTTRLVRATSSALSAAPAAVTLTWTNIGAAGTYYVGLRGYLAFTTGTYSLAISPLNEEDSDGDGLWDSWEFMQFGWLDSGPDEDEDRDGFSNIDEFYAKTSPTNAASALRLTPRRLNPGLATLSWPVVPDSVYRVWRATNLNPSSWIPLDSIYHPAQGGTNLLWDDELGGNRQFYKVELQITP